MTGYLLLAGCGHGLKTSAGHDDGSNSSDSLCQVKFELLQFSNTEQALRAYQ